MATTISDDELRAKLAEQPLESAVRGDPALLERIRETFEDLRTAADAVPLQSLIPDLATIPATEKFPNQETLLAEHERHEKGDAPGPTTPFSRGENGVWGSAYQPLAAVLERSKASVLSDLQEGTSESIARAEASAMGLVAVGRLFKHVEPRRQMWDLTIPGHEELVGYAVKQLIRAGARARNGTICDAACKLMIGCSFDRLCVYNISEHFDVRKGRGLGDGWSPPPEDAPLYGIGIAMLHGPSPLSALRVLVTLTSAERWLVAETTLALLGTAVCGAKDESHTGPPAPSPLREGLLRCLTEPACGELLGVLAAVSITGMNQRSEHPGGLLRARLATPLITAWRDRSRPVTAGLCAFALFDLCNEAVRNPYRPDRDLYSAKTEEEVDRLKVPASAAADPEKWRAGQRRHVRNTLALQAEYDAGTVLFKQELEAARDAAACSARARGGQHAV